MKAEVINLSSLGAEYLDQVAQILYDGFIENWPEAWPSFGKAMEEVKEALTAEKRINLVCIDNENKIVLGWIGGISERKGKVWELHPLVVNKSHQKKGIGKRLVEDFEMEVKKRGGLTIWLGSDDENYMTSIGGKDLYPDLLENLLNIENIKGHPFEFYQKMGFSIAGILPDANGVGKPDIFMAKKVK